MRFLIVQSQQVIRWLQRDHSWWRVVYLRSTWIFKCVHLRSCHVDIHEKWFIAFFSFYVTLTSISVLLGLNDTYVLQEVNVFDFSTHDGTAIAYAVLRALAEKVRCRAFFSTHYHSLCNAVRDVPNIKAAHMVSFPFSHFLLCLKVDELIVFECYDERST